MNIIYISPSIIPSKSANSVHVLRMAEAIQDQNHNLTLYCMRPFWNKLNYQSIIHNQYGINLGKTKIRSFFSPFNRGLQLLSGFVFFILAFWQTHAKKTDLIISRNFYASFFLSLISNVNHIYETHSPEVGLKKTLQAFIVNSKNTKTVVISEALKRILISHLKLPIDIGSQIKVFHDAAPADLLPLTSNQKIETRIRFFEKETLRSFNFFAGYFGHLYQGRGVEIILELAKKESALCFMIFGGNDSDIERIKMSHLPPNVILMGHTTHENALIYMRSMDVLLMPYQDKVSIGTKHSDTSKWMSPMKMFEYMSAGVPILSSSLPVLEEVLQHEKNALLSNPTSVEEWQKNLKRIINDPTLATRISKEAYQNYESEYTWSKRAFKIINILK